LGSKHEKLAVWSQQVLLRDASVYSKQWIFIPVETADLDVGQNLLDLYLAHIRRCTLSAIRPSWQEEGIKFRLLGFNLSLLSFAPPDISRDSGLYRITLSLNGGFLVQPGECERGRFCLAAQRGDRTVSVSVELSDYCPLLLGSSSPSRARKLLYRLTQAYIHKVVTIRFLASLFQRATNLKPRLTVIRDQSREGEDI
jgi:hypothetical protein